MVSVYLDFRYSDVPLTFRWHMPRVRRRRPRKPTWAKSRCLLQVWGSNGNRVNVVSERLSLSSGTWQIFLPAHIIDIRSLSSLQFCSSSRSSWTIILNYKSRVFYILIENHQMFTNVLTRFIPRYLKQKN